MRDPFKRPARTKLVRTLVDGEPVTFFRDEPPHTVRSIGNSVGLPPGRNTNRPKPQYMRKLNRKARRLGFDSAAHLAIFKTLMTAQIAKQQEEA